MGRCVHEADEKWGGESKGADEKWGGESVTELSSPEAQRRQLHFVHAARPVKLLTYAAVLEPGLECSIYWNNTNVTPGQNEEIKRVSRQANFMTVVLVCINYRSAVSRLTHNSDVAEPANITQYIFSRIGFLTWIHIDFTMTTRRPIDAIISYVKLTGLI